MLLHLVACNSNSPQNVIGWTLLYFTQKPGKKLFGQSGWIVQAKLNIQLWFGEHNPRKPVKDYLENLPHGYEPIYEFESTDIPPIGLMYEGKLNLHHHLYSENTIICSYL